MAHQQGINYPGQDKIRTNLKDVKHTVMVISGKGGVGKSTIATNLAFSLSIRGKRVGLMDIDIHGPNIAKMAGADNVEAQVLPEGTIEPVFVPPGVGIISIASFLKDKDAPVIWRGPLKMKLISQFLGDVHWNALDFLIVDSPPGTGDEPLSVAQLVPKLAGVIIVTTPQEVALLDARKAINFAHSLHIPILGIIENMSGFVCPHCGQTTDIFKTGNAESAARALSVPFAGRVPLDPGIVTSGDSGLPFVLSKDQVRAKDNFDSILENIMEQIDTQDNSETETGSSSNE